MNERPRGAKEFQRLLQRHAADIDQLPQRVIHLVRVGDIWLLDTLLEPGDLPQLRDATLRTFHRRRKHTWPPAIRPSPSWATDYPALAAAHPDAPSTIDHAIAYLTDLITRIDNTTSG